MRAMISGQAGLVVILGDDPVAYPVDGGSSLTDPYRIARSLDACSDLQAVEVDNVDEAMSLGVELRRASLAAIERNLLDAGFDGVEKSRSDAQARQPHSERVSLVGEAKSKREVLRSRFKKYPAVEAGAGRSQSNAGGGGRAIYRIGTSRHRAQTGGAALAVAEDYSVVTAVGSDSAEIQVAVLTERIKNLTEHFKGHAKDNHSRRGLLMLINKRRSLLDFLRKRDSNRYMALIAQLGLRK